ncbi:TadE/TadG family type IV pilus assembly protein [Thalassovita aquimarina]|uniref:Pilus assembly protein n=1 Tax=Thalassovita aquimarina TaxID=2785917 RepID=A0ABS5HS69_9RHOB|nr:TadE/TadG family type IV pilus assembly protein [Thalassovita aquimarina]MBR9651686.1 pilus assembly protein [Thalassovita aquimarina]
MKPVRFIRGFLRGEDGVAALDFAIVGSVYMLMLVALLDVARGFYLHNKLEFAADKITRQLLMDPNATIDSIDMPPSLDGFDATLLVVETQEVTISGAAFHNLSLYYPMSMLTPLLKVDLVDLKIQRLIPIPN